MKKILCLMLVIIHFSFANEPSLEQQAFKDEDGEVFSDTDFGEDIDNPNNSAYLNKMVFLDAVQKHFWNPKRNLQDNNYNILHKDGDTHMIRTRYAMVTTIIFDDDKIAQIILGDPNGFELTELGKNKWDLSNIITIKPKLIGIDTNLTIIGESGTIYTFYLFSTHFTNRRNPAFTVFVSKRRKIGKIAMENLEEEAKNNLTFKKQIHNKEDMDTRKIAYATIEEDDGEFITIGDKINKLHIDKSKIKRGYVQKPKSKRSFKTFFLKKESKEALRMMAIDIFNDNDYTYFKFDREDANSKFPVLFKVVDGYDNPVNTKIVGNYIIAEDLSDKWTLKMGDEWVCIQRLEKPLIIQKEVLRQEQSSQEEIPSPPNVQKTNIQESNQTNEKELDEQIRKNKERIEALKAKQSQYQNKEAK